MLKPAWPTDMRLFRRTLLLLLAISAALSYIYLRSFTSDAVSRSYNVLEKSRQTADDSDQPLTLSPDAPDPDSVAPLKLPDSELSSEMNSEKISNFPVSMVSPQDPPRLGEPADVLVHLDNSHSNLTRGSGELTRSLSSDSAIHVALIFDSNRVDYALQVSRSVAFYSASTTTLHFHIIAPVNIHPRLPNTTSLPNINFHFYNYDICVSLTRVLVAFSNSRIHISAHCKLFLSKILPKSVERVLFMDNDITAVRDVMPCYSAPFADSQYIGMAVDMGDVCQLYPNQCWPIGNEWTLPASTICGNSASKWNAKTAFKDKNCPKPGDTEPFQLNGGVILMDLTKMRERDFVGKLAQVVFRTARVVNFKKARWGEQDFINSFFRVHPEALQVLECGCNYQYSGVRKEVKCAGQTIYMAHGWTSGTHRRTIDPYNNHFYHFLSTKSFPFSDSILRLPTPPKLPFFSASFAASVKEQPMSLPVPGCPHQKWNCSQAYYNIGEVYSEGLVYILTRTSGRPNFFRQMRQSVEDQSWPHIRHLVVTDDAASVDYVRAAGIPEEDIFTVSSSYGKFDPNEACKCQDLLQKRSNSRSCSEAPGLDRPNDRKSFLNCYCNTNYPMNEYIQVLHERIKTLGPENQGWIMYLDDDNLFLQPHAVTELMSRVRAKNELLLFRSLLGRPTPSDRNFGKIVMGDIDASGFMFHSNHIDLTRWSNLRCGDYWTASSLGEHLKSRWIGEAYIGMNPLRSKLGGLGLRGDISGGHANLADMVTVVITSFSSEGYRPLWLKYTLMQYTKEDMKSLIHKVILVWNNPDVAAPEIPGVTLLRMTRNSLNNRWTETVPHIETEVVLNLDDDLLVGKDGILCMLSYWMENKDRVIGPYVRGQRDGHYALDELIRGPDTTYSIVLPRVMMLHRRYLEHYRDQLAPHVKEYVDTQEGHCDDIALNAEISFITKHAPFRVILPPESVIDYFDNCYAAHRQLTGGLALQKNRGRLRDECVHWIAKQYENLPSGNPVLGSESIVGTCGLRGISLGKEKKLLEWRFRAMKKPITCDMETWKSMVQ